MTTPSRPPHQRWIKRPPRPSRAAPPRTGARDRPGMRQAVLALGFALGTGILAAMVGPQLVPRPGMGGLFAGLGFMAGFMALWRSFGGTLQDIRDLFA
jgi:hypothetical protein